MTSEMQRQHVIYFACRRALERVDQLKGRKSGKDFSATLHLERQGYVEVANELAEALDLEPVE